jgi:predicted dehydrogenase
MDYGLSRRQFLKHSGAGLAALPVAAALTARGQAPAPSARVTMGCIGVGGQGTGDMHVFLNDPRVQVVAVCDVDRQRAQAAGKTVAAFYAERKQAGSDAGCQVTQDFREVLAREDIDTVLIATPDHTHALISIWAARAGKDIYCEKPLAYSVAEGRAVTAAVQRYGRILQTGTQRRSDGRIRHACELVRNGRLGEFRRAVVGLPRGFQIHGGGSGGNPAPEPVPEGFDYDMWLGPAPEVPYTPGRCHFNFRWILDYGEGYISDWGAHYLDVAHWGLGMDLTGPTAVTAKAVFPQEGLYDAPTEFDIEYTYANGMSLLCSTNQTLGIYFEGSEGWLHIEKPGAPHVAASDERLLKSDIEPGGIRLYRSGKGQHGNFIDCVFTRQEPAAPAELGHRSASVCHVGMIAARLGRPLRWDPAAERFVDDPEADRLLFRPMRYPWAV